MSEYTKRPVKERKTYHAANDQKPDDDQHGIAELLRIRPLTILIRQRVKELKTDVEIEDGRDADRTKITNEQSLPGATDLADVAVQAQDDRQPPEQQYKNTQREETTRADQLRRPETLPGTHGAEPHEDGHVEHHVHGGLDGVVERLEAEPVVPREGVAGDEASQHVVAADHAAGAEDEDGHADGEEQEALALDVLVALGPVEQRLREPADDPAVEDAHQHDVDAGLAEEEADRGREAALTRYRVAVAFSVLDEVQRQEEEGVPEAVVGPGLGDDDLLQVLWDVLIGEASLDDGG